MEESVKSNDLDVQIRFRSSKMPSSELLKLTNQVVEFLSQSSELGLVEQNLSVQKTKDKTLSSVTVILQSAE